MSVLRVEYHWPSIVAAIVAVIFASALFALATTM